MERSALRDLAEAMRVLVVGLHDENPGCRRRRRRLRPVQGGQRHRRDRPERLGEHRARQDGFVLRRACRARARGGAGLLWRGIFLLRDPTSSTTERDFGFWYAFCYTVTQSSSCPESFIQKWEGQKMGGTKSAMNMTTPTRIGW